MKVGNLRAILEDMDADDEAHIVIADLTTERRCEIDTIFEDHDGLFNIITHQRSAGDLAPDLLESVKQASSSTA
jgi:hypothetical protein